MSALLSRVRALSRGTLVGLALLVIGGPAHAAETPAPWPPTDGVIIDRLVAIVNTEPVTHFELRRAAMPFVAKVVTESTRDELPAKLRQVQAEVLDNLINDILVYSEAKKLGLTVAPERVDTHIERIRTANGWSTDELAEQLRRLGFASLTDYRRHTEREMMKSQAISIKVGSRVQIDEKEVEAEVQRRLGTENTVEERRAAHILIAVEAMATEELVEKMRQRLVEAKARIESGEVSFEEVAREMSEDAGTRPAGGDLGWFVRGDFDPDFEAVAFSAPSGTITDPVRTQFGFHLIKITGIRDRKVEGEQDLDKMRREIRFKMRQAGLETHYSKWVKGLRSQAFVEVKDVRFLRQDGARPPNV